MGKRKTLVAALVALAATAGVGSFVVGTSPDASAADGGVWKVDCSYSHSAPDDPIVFPGRPGASHLHDFFGNISTGAHSTYESMNGVTSTCANNDRAGYWVPALYRDGKKIKPNAAVVYYINSAGDPKNQIAFPPDMRIIIGNSKATRLDQVQGGGQIEWGCEGNTQISKVMPKNCSSGKIQLRLRFPACWDGKMDADNNATAHVRYPSGGRCPQGFPHAMPTMRMNIQYPVGTTTGDITLSSGSVYSVHADFWNVWHQPTLDGLVKKCLQAVVNCGRFKGTSPGRAP